MSNPLRALMWLLGQWSREQETALMQLTKRKAAGQRIAGFHWSKRVDAKFLLLALAPFLLLALSDGLGWSRGLLWHAILWLGIAWAVFVMGHCFAGYSRALRRLWPDIVRLLGGALGRRQP